MSDDDLIQLDFFQAVRLLERRASQPDAEPGALQDFVRFGAHASFAFPSREVHAMTAIRFPSGRILPLMVVNIMGLTGPQGAMPTVYTGAVVEARLRSWSSKSFGDRVPAEAFFDMFNDRMLHFFYHAWKKHRLTIHFEDDKHHSKSNQNGIPSFLRSLIGLENSHFLGKQLSLDSVFLFCSGLLGPRPRSAVALEQMIASVFGVHAHVDQFAQTWTKLQRNMLTRLDAAQLGANTILGIKVRTPSSAIRVRIGPVSSDVFNDFLPGGYRFQRVCSILKFFCPPEFKVDLEVHMLKSEVPPCILGGPSVAGLPLGWSTWLHFDNAGPHSASATIPLDLAGI